MNLRAWDLLSVPARTANPIVVGELSWTGLSRDYLTSALVLLSSLDHASGGREL